MPKIVMHDLDQKAFEKFGEKIKKLRESKDRLWGEKKPFFDLDKVYSGMSTKQSHLMKGFAANYLKLLKQSITENSGTGSVLNLSTFFMQGEYVV